jgi:N6-L-threonylcarbamoyladenine synthase
MLSVLGIETSCDETAVARLAFDAGGRAFICAEVISSQIKLHELYGGVVPELASREHLTNLPILVHQVLGGGTTEAAVDLIGVTSGPGLQGCLLMGACFAKGLGMARGIPVQAVNHCEGHLLSPLVTQPELDFPFLGLIVSGGHTEIVAARALGTYEIIARTVDDAAGEAFDKSAYLLGFPYPGGAMLARTADEYGRSDFKLPRVMRAAPGFSFSGLKTAIALLIKEHPAAVHDPELRGALAWAIQEAIVDALCFKVERAAAQTGLTKLVVAGGVSANRRLRVRLGGIRGLEVFYPADCHCTDNGAMIAYAAARHFLREDRTPPDFTVRSRWPLETLA